MEKVGIKQIDKMLDELDIQPILNCRVRRVRWLYVNNNKLAMVFDEKLVRAIVQRFEDKISELESEGISKVIKKELQALHQQTCFKGPQMEIIRNCQDFKSQYPVLQSIIDGTL